MLRLANVESSPVKAAANLNKHGVSFAHASQALCDPQAMTVEDINAVGEHRFVTMGQDALGRLMIVGYTQRAGRTRLISARKASRGEDEAYHA